MVCIKNFFWKEKSLLGYIFGANTTQVFFVFKKGDIIQSAICIVLYLVKLLLLKILFLTNYLKQCLHQSPIFSFQKNLSCAWSL